MTAADITRCIEAVDKRKRQGEDQERDGGKFQPKSSSGLIGESAQTTADIVGTSASKRNPPEKNGKKMEKKEKKP